VEEFHITPNNPYPVVTEAEWLACADAPWWMVRPFHRARVYLAEGDGSAAPRPDHSPSCREWRERKARLLCVEAFRPLWLLFPGPRGLPFRELVGAVARRADGLGTDADVDAAFAAAMEGAEWEELWDGTIHLAVYALQMGWRVAQANRAQPPDALVYAVMFAIDVAVGTAYEIRFDYRDPFDMSSVFWHAVTAAGYRAERGPVVHSDADGHAGGRARMAAHLCHLVRDVFGNPFRPVAFDPAWRTKPAVALARRMYAAREFSDMPILADALQDAGCEHPAILDHCQSTGPHVRGCWVIDLVRSVD
jgi:hypothetical protein